MSLSDNQPGRIPFRPVNGLDEERGLRDLLLTLTHGTGQAAACPDPDDRDEIASELLRYSDANGDGWADVIDTTSIHPDVRRRVVRLLAEIDAAGWAAV